jgi:anaerobic magnesium-protoporphyrin IX monomethyl ester cyclase
MSYRKNRFVSYVTSRGCPFGCAFCSTHLMWGSKFRPFSATRVLDEIDYILDRYGAEEFEFSDDNLTLNKKRILDILHGFIKRGYNFTWTHPNAVAVVTLDREVLEAMRGSGCDVLTIAPESGCERVLKEIIHKPVTKDKIREAVKMAKEIGFKIQAAWIVGFPGETRDEIDETRDFILELKLDRNQISIATPFLGTEMYSLCKEKGYLVEAANDFERYRYGFANIRTQDWDEKWLKQKAYDINIEVNFVKNHSIEDDPKYAVNMFEDILSRYPKHLVASQCLARAYDRIGKKDKAKSIQSGIKTLIKHEPEIYGIYKKYMENAWV